MHLFSIIYMRNTLAVHSYVFPLIHIAANRSCLYSVLYAENIHPLQVISAQKCLEICIGILWSHVLEGY